MCSVRFSLKRTLQAAPGQLEALQIPMRCVFYFIFPQPTPAVRFLSLSLCLGFEFVSCYQNEFRPRHENCKLNTGEVYFFRFEDLSDVANKCVEGTFYVFNDFVK